jgi:hypothetical protein
MLCGLRVLFQGNLFFHGWLSDKNLQLRIKYIDLVGVHGPNRCPLCLQNNEDHNSAKERPVESDVRQIDKSPIGDKEEFQTMHQVASPSERH